jgi:hypothetical protein
LNFNRCRSSRAGIKNANVFPDPVLAAPKTSFPASNRGILFACIGVIVLNPIPSSALCVCDERSYVENGNRSVVEAGVSLVVDEPFVVRALGSSDEEGCTDESSFVDSASFFGEASSNFDLLFFFLETDFEVDAIAVAIAQEYEFVKDKTIKVTFELGCFSRRQRQGKKQPEQIDLRPSRPNSEKSCSAFTEI